MAISTRTRCPSLNTLLRMAAGLPVSDRRPVEIVDSGDAPVLAGQSYYHTTLSGKTIVRYPSAYGYRTWYHPSTRRVEVPKSVLAQLRAVVAAYDAAVKATVATMVVA